MKKLRIITTNTHLKAKLLSSLAHGYKEAKRGEPYAFIVYIITPKLKRLYPLAKALDDSNKQPEKTILVLLSYDGSTYFTLTQWRSFYEVAELIERNGGKLYTDLRLAIKHLKRKELSNGYTNNRNFHRGTLYLQRTKIHPCDGDREER